MLEQRIACFSESEPRLQLRLPVLLAVASLVSGGLVLVGCGPKSDRLAVSGKVTLNGAALDGGSIRLESRVGDKILASGATIRNGEYTIPAEKGLPPGIYRVEISAPDNAAPPVADRVAPGERGAPPSAPERVPAEYNVDSKKTIEVTAEGENHFEFEIVNRSAK